MNKWDYKTKITPGSLVVFDESSFYPMYAFVISVERAKPNEIMLGRGPHYRIYVAFIHEKGLIRKHYVPVDTKYVRQITD